MGSITSGYAYKRVYAAEASLMVKIIMKFDIEAFNVFYGADYL